MKPRRGTLSARTLPCDCGENRRIKGIWICLGEKSQRKRERICPENCPKSKKERKRFLGVFIAKIWPFSFWRPLSGRWPPLLTSAVLAFWSRFGRIFEGLLDLDWVELGILGKLWMSSFQNTKEIGNSTVESKVMALGSMLTRFAWFSGYLNCFNSDFDPWIVVGKGIQ